MCAPVDTKPQSEYDVQDHTNIKSKLKTKMGAHS